ncbi:mucin-3A-like isoform X2 [Haliotis asinina]|uniref:mucin-3A-like isoform X2 n=1 Tax=Haliotis asinina TaxID=109174 RepID=UPI003532717B
MDPLTKLIFVLAAILFADKCSCQEIGTVHIGDSTGSTNTTTYSFNTNQGPQSLPIYIQITDLADPSTPVALRDTVDITCEASDDRLGYTSVTFNPLSFSPGNPISSSISFTLTRAGRSVDIRCFGTSRGLACPANTTTGATPPQPQFCPSTSLSSPVLLTVRPAPIVSFCEDVVTVPNDNTLESTFSLALSEVVMDNPVNITCRITVYGGLNVTIPQVTVDINESKKTALYQITSQGPFSQVMCTANSQGGGNQYLTTTSAVFSQSVGTVSLLPVITPAYSSSFKGILVLDAGVSVDNGISFECQAVVADSMTQALQLIQTPLCNFTTVNATTTPVATSPPTTTPATSPPTTDNSTTDPNATTTTPSLPITTPIPVDLSSPWRPDESSFTFTKKGQTYKTVTVRRARAVIAPVTELVVLTCCVRDSTPKYTGMAAAMLTANDLTPDFCTNCTGGPSSGSVDSERVIQNPSFVEVAPCPCDLTYSICDINCCCDADCTADRRKTFSYCLPGPYGGQGSVTPFRSCYSNHTFKEDWFPMMCVEFETNALLGLFYGNTAAVKTDTAFNTRLSEQTTTYSYRETERRFTDPNSGLVGYKEGASIRTRRGDLPSSPRGVLTLPARSMGGTCLNVVPVRFLQDRSSDCVHNNVRSMCTADSMLSARMYAEMTSMSHPPCPEAYRILETYGGTIGNTYVSYYCDVSDTSYVKSSVKYSDLVSPTVSWTFQQELNTENCSLPCSEPACLQYNEGQETVTSLPPRCSWDDGYSRPPIPSLASNVCNNVVVDVRYSFTWSGQRIINLNATVILAPITLGVNPPSLTQSFDVKFMHEMAIQSDSSDNYENQTGIFDRSGKPGYDYGKPLMSGCPVNDASSSLLYVDRNTSRQMSVFQTGVDGLCYSATRRPLTFGEDILTSCDLRLNIDQINNCSDLQQLVLNHLSVLMPSDLIGRQGYNDPFDSTMWVTVLRDLPILNETTVDNSTVPDNTTDDVYLPVDNVRGVCANITSGVNLVVLYGDTGQVNNYTIREVVGARVSYTKSHWRMQCSGAKSARCENSSQYVQTFTLTSSVTFVKVPASVPEPRIKFYTSKDPSCTTDTCARYYEDFEQTVCKYDACWTELLYPITKSYGADPPMYTLAFSLVAVFFITGYFMITRPWF